MAGRSVTYHSSLPAQHEANNLIKPVTLVTTTQLMLIGSVKMVAGAFVVIFKQGHHAFAPEFGYGKHRAFKAIPAHIRPGNVPADIIVMVVALRIHKPVNRNNTPRPVLISKNQAGNPFIPPAGAAVAEFVKVDGVIMLFLFAVVIAVQRRLREACIGKEDRYA